MMVDAVATLKVIPSYASLMEVVDDARLMAVLRVFKVRGLACVLHMEEGSDVKSMAALRAPGVAATAVFIMVEGYAVR